MLVADAEHALPRPRHPRAAAAGRGPARRPPGPRARSARRARCSSRPRCATCSPRRTGGGCSRRASPGASAGEIARRRAARADRPRVLCGRERPARGGGVRRLDRFGATALREALDPILALLIVIVLVALLLPVAVLVGAAVRTGGEDRDRRLAALRLIGADQRMARRIAAGEALVSAAPGCVLGALAFFVRARSPTTSRSGTRASTRAMSARARCSALRWWSASRPRPCSSRCSRCGASWPSRSASSGAPRRRAAGGCGGGCCSPRSAWSRSCPPPARGRRTRSASCASRSA